MELVDQKPIKTKDTPKDQFCLVCEKVFYMTEKDFNNCGHVNTATQANKKYAMTDAMVKHVVHRLRSGVFGSEHRNLEVKS